MSDRDNDFKGAMFTDNNCEIIYKGTIQINGDTRYYSLLRTKTQKGEEIIELAMSCGRVYINSPEQKKSETTPDVGGNIRIDGTKYKFGGWNNVAKSGQNYLGVSLRKSEDDIPF